MTTLYKNEIRIAITELHQAAVNCHRLIYEPDASPMAQALLNHRMEQLNTIADKLESVLEANSKRIAVKEAHQ